MRKIIVVCLLLSGILFWTGTDMVQAVDNQEVHHKISPDSPLYFMDRLIEDISPVFMSEKKQVNYYLERAIERFYEAKDMFRADKTDRGFELLKEGVGNIGKSIKAWRECLSRDVKVDDLKAEMKDVIQTGKELFEEFKNDLNAQQMAEFTKEIGKVLKEQISLFLNLDKR